MCADPIHNLTQLQTMTEGEHSLTSCLLYAVEMAASNY